MPAHMETPVYNPMYTPLYTPLHRPSAPPVTPPVPYNPVCRAIATGFMAAARLVSTVMHALIRLAVTIGAVLLIAPSLLHGQERATHAVAARPLARGAVLTAADIQWADSASSTQSRSNAVAPGWIARRAIRAGEPLSPPSVSRADVVTTGDAVDVVYQDDEVTLRMKGTAIGTGAEGDRIYVRLDNRRRLRGVIAGPHRVEIVQ